MDPFYFGAPGALRFAVYHAPARPSARAVLLLYPLGHEYIRAHRAFRNLALSLSRAGIPVLRFDYTGSGDSSGESRDVRLAQLEEDADAAIEELKRRTGAARVSLVGLRLGGALAALAAARRDDIESLVLWDPVVSGRWYLGELAALQAGWLRDRLGAGTEDLVGDAELLGMPVHPELVNDLLGVDLVNGPYPKADAVSILVSAPRSDCVEWLRALNSHSLPATYSQVHSAGDWLNPEAVHQLLLPHAIIARIVALTTA